MLELENIKKLQIQNRQQLLDTKPNNVEIEKKEGKKHAKQVSFNRIIVMDNEKLCDSKHVLDM